MTEQMPTEREALVAWLMTKSVRETADAILATPPAPLDTGDAVIQALDQLEWTVPEDEDAHYPTNKSVFDEAIVRAIQAVRRVYARAALPTRAEGDA